MQVNGIKIEDFVDMGADLSANLRAVKRVIQPVGLLQPRISLPSSLLKEWPMIIILLLFICISKIRKGLLSQNLLTVMLNP